MHHIFDRSIKHQLNYLLKLLKISIEFDLHPKNREITFSNLSINRYESSNLSLVLNKDAFYQMSVHPNARVRQIEASIINSTMISFL